MLLFSTGAALGSEDDKIVIITTQHGDIVMELFPKDAPNTVDSFYKLVESGFYDGIIFHRVIPGFMIQGGDPNTKQSDQSIWGQGNPGFSIDAEFNSISHLKGIVSMARSTDPNSAGSQFFIIHSDSTFLDQQYTVFGRIITQESFDVVEKIINLERNSRDVPNDLKQATILSASITTRAQIQNSLDLDEPKRITITTIPESNSDYTQYTNEKFGVSFAVPTTWAGQSLDPVDENTPDFVTVGPLINGNPTVLQFKTVSLSNITADEYLDNFKAIINEDITSGFLDVISEEEIVVDGKRTLVFSSVWNLSSIVGIPTILTRIQATIVDTDEIYQLVYLIDGNRTSEKQLVFERALETFTVSDSKQITSTPDDINDKSLQDNSQEGGCLVATAAFNTELSPEIQQLREFRDDIVLKTESGSIFMTNFNQIYYSFSPILADAERDNPALQLMIRSTLTPLFSSLLLLDQLNIDSEIEMLTYGIGIIILNLTLYIIAPILLAYKIRNIFGVKLNLKHTSKIQ